MRHHPISPVTEPLQYRAIGVVRGQYVPTDAEQPTRGLIRTADGTEIEAVVLGRVLSLVRRHLDMASPHLWVVYPRIREPGSLHLQIMGVWEPSTLDAACGPATEDQPVDLQPPSDQPLGDQLPEGDDYFSVRGELIFTRPESDELVIKVRQKPRADGSRVQPFKLQLRGQIPLEHLRHFVSLDLRRQASQLQLERCEVIAPVAQRGNRGGKDRVGKERGAKDRGGPDRSGLTRVEPKSPRGPLSRGEAPSRGSQRTAIIRPGG
ncbi:MULTISPECIES: hypothetical protein [unclassified Synechococcus]|uniref:hypothetical protein n=1 Tax=unclassified Synechococcus TaxID=2626047 RepID=UPI0020CF0343|nr:MULTISPECIES: hypothetical protein [unclassified Synechococcus]